MKNIRCLLGFHKWTRRDRDGMKLIACVRCGKEDDEPTPMIPMG